MTTPAPFVTTHPDGRSLMPGGNVFRPPSEADSLLLQVSVGCSHNRCSYCAMYQGKRFAIRPQADIEALIDAFASQRPAPSRRVFLCDGDALILPQARLVATLTYLRQRLPWVQRVAVLPLRISPLGMTTLTRLVQPTYSPIPESPRQFLTSTPTVGPLPGRLQRHSPRHANAWPPKRPTACRSFW